MNRNQVGNEHEDFLISRSGGVISVRNPHSFTKVILICWLRVRVGARVLSST